MANEPRPVVLIVEPYHDIAVALHEIVSLAHCTPRAAVAVIEPHDVLRDGAIAAIVLRMTARDAIMPLLAHLAHWPPPWHPMLIALTSTDHEVDAATRLGCQMILREPWQVRRLYDTLAELARGHRAGAGSRKTLPRLADDFVNDGAPHACVGEDGAKIRSGQAI